MKFAKIVFWCAGIWGVLILTPLYFMLDLIGRQDPPPITHPAFYYGFVGAGLAWQFAFLVMATNPVRFRPIILPAVFEKVAYGVTAVVLYSRGNLKPGDLVFGGIDLLFALLFVIAFLKIKEQR